MFCFPTFQMKESKLKQAETCEDSRHFRGGRRLVGFSVRTFLSECT